MEIAIDARLFSSPTARPIVMEETSARKAIAVPSETQQEAPQAAAAGSTKAHATTLDGHSCADCPAVRSGGPQRGDRASRSEERRVGKECRSRRWQYAETR